MANGWIVLDKPCGLGSTQAVAAVKRALRQAGFAKPKVGHGGTLDPLASGVLPIAVGEATKLAGRLLESSKDYVFTVRFGEETDSLDDEGTVVATSAVRPTLAEVAAVLPRFAGPITQTPPAFSALKVGGRRAYDLARAGEDVVLASREVVVERLEVRGADGVGATGAAQPPDHAPLDAVTLFAHVSKGTYIRSLARDLARALGTVGRVTMLRRLRAGPFALAQAISLDNCLAIGQGAPLENAILPLEAGLDGIPALDLGPEQARAVRQGRVLTGPAFQDRVVQDEVLHDGILQDGVYWARHGTIPVALVELSGNRLTVLRGFNLADAAE